MVTQLDLISRTLQVLEQRVSSNEDNIDSVMTYFRDIKEQRAVENRQATQQYNFTNPTHFNLNGLQSMNQPGAFNFNQNELNQQLTR